jgi:hypothetical protein
MDSKVNKMNLKEGHGVFNFHTKKLNKNGN